MKNRSCDGLMLSTAEACHSMRYTTCVSQVKNTITHVSILSHYCNSIEDIHMRVLHKGQYYGSFVELYTAITGVQAA